MNSFTICQWTGSQCLIHLQGKSPPLKAEIALQGSFRPPAHATPGQLVLSLGVAHLKNELDQDTPRAETAGGIQQTLDARIAAPREASVNVVHLGQRAGRFVLLSEIGRGGMGTVYSAYDAHLERKVAIKLLHRDTTAEPSSHRRLLREAQAMARVSHPNVVSVYDVGEIDSQVFIAMEFIDGNPLSIWQKQPNRKWAEVVEMYLQAGRGLAAAHGMGLIHRDFKPDNVLVGRDGRARVLDFGLARFDELQPEEPCPALPETTSQPWTRTHTGAGTCAGTPGYMSPEQYLGAPLDARSDQFSFCVALYEGQAEKRLADVQKIEPDATGKIPLE